MYRNLDKLKIENVLIDTHAHLSVYGLDEIAHIVADSKANLVQQIWNVTTTSEEFVLALELAKVSEIKTFVGIDPYICIPGSSEFQPKSIDINWIDSQVGTLETFIEANRNNILGIGEIGLDLYQYKNLKENSEYDIDLLWESQKYLLSQQLAIAQKYALPVSLHSRDAEAECVEICSKFLDVCGIFHSFGGDIETAHNVLEIGWSLGINGIITFKKSFDVRQKFKTLLKNYQKSKYRNPIDFYSSGFFFETDSPYLSPEGMRGSVNKPQNVRAIYDFVLEMVS